MTHPETPVRYLSNLCAEQGCTRECRSWSRFCTLHARRRFDNRDPNGRIFRKGELKPYAVMAENFLKMHAEHKAIVAAEEYMASLLYSGALSPRLRKQMERLRTSGASRHAMLVQALSVFGLFYYHPAAHGLRSVSAMNLGRRVLGTVPFPQRTTRRGQGYTIRPTGSLCQELGELLLDNLAPFAAQFWTAAEARLTAPQRAISSLSAALESEPLVDPQVAAEIVIARARA